MLIFSHSVATCANLYKLFLTSLKEESYEPLGSSPTITNRLFAMYHAKVDEYDKVQILDSVTKPVGNCWVLFFTIALAWEWTFQI